MSAATAGIACGCCGDDVPPTRADGTYNDGDRMICASCGASNQVSIEEVCGPEDNEFTNEAAFNLWWCKHGVDSDTLCGPCETDAGHYGNVTP